MLNYIVSLFTTAISSPLKLILTVAATLTFAVIAVANRKTLRLTGGDSVLDVIFGLVAGALFGALTGILWAGFNPVQLAPGIHLRLFAFLPCVVGVLLGEGTGFISGYIATLVWAQLSGLFIPLHSPIVDGIFVGLTGWIPAWLIRGNKSNQELLEEANENTWRWVVKNGLVCLFAGLFMSTFVAISLEATIDLPFSTGFAMIGLASDTGPMVVVTGLMNRAMLQATKPMWNFLRTF